MAYSLISKVSTAGVICVVLGVSFPETLSTAASTFKKFIPSLHFASSEDEFEERVKVISSSSSMSATKTQTEMLSPPIISPDVQQASERYFPGSSSPFHRVKLPGLEGSNANGQATTNLLSRRIEGEYLLQSGFVFIPSFSKKAERVPLLAAFGQGKDSEERFIEGMSDPFTIILLNNENTNAHHLRGTSFFPGFETATREEVPIITRIAALKREVASTSRSQLHRSGAVALTKSELIVPPAAPILTYPTALTGIPGIQGEGMLATLLESREHIGSIVLHRTAAHIPTYSTLGVVEGSSPILPLTASVFQPEALRIVPSGAIALTKSELIVPPAAPILTYPTALTGIQDEGVRATLLESRKHIGSIMPADAPIPTLTNSFMVPATLTGTQREGMVATFVKIRNPVAKPESIESIVPALATVPSPIYSKIFPAFFETAIREEVSIITGITALKREVASRNQLHRLGAISELIVSADAPILTLTNSFIVPATLTGIQREEGVLPTFVESREHIGSIVLRRTAAHIPTYSTLGVVEGSSPILPLIASVFQEEDFSFKEGGAGRPAPFREETATLVMDDMGDNNNPLVKLAGDLIPDYERQKFLDRQALKQIHFKIGENDRALGRLEINSKSAKEEFFIQRKTLEKAHKELESQVESNQKEVINLLAKKDDIVSKMSRTLQAILAEATDKQKIAGERIDDLTKKRTEREVSFFKARNGLKERIKGLKDQIKFHENQIKFHENHDSLLASIKECLVLCAKSEELDDEGMEEPEADEEAEEELEVDEEAEESEVDEEEEELEVDEEAIAAKAREFVEELQTRTDEEINMAFTVLKEKMPSDKHADLLIQSGQEKAIELRNLKAHLGTGLDTEAIHTIDELRTIGELSKRLNIIEADQELLGREVQRDLDEFDQEIEKQQTSLKHIEQTVSEIADLRKDFERSLRSIQAKDEEDKILGSFQKQLAEKLGIHSTTTPSLAVFNKGCDEFRANLQELIKKAEVDVDLQNKLKGKATALSDLAEKYDREAQIRTSQLHSHREKRDELEGMRQDQEQTIRLTLLMLNQLKKVASGDSDPLLLASVREASCLQKERELTQYSKPMLIADRADEVLSRLPLLPPTLRDCGIEMRNKSRSLLSEGLLEERTVY